MALASTTYTRTEILKLNKSLIENKKYMEVFSSYGIQRETIIKFLIGLDIDETIVCPIFNEDWEVIGKVVYYDFYKDPRGSLTKPTCSGLLGFSKTNGSAITVCKDIIDMMLAFENGIPFPVVLTDKQNPPHFLRKYNKIHFFSDNDELIDIVYGQAFTYGIDDLHRWLLREAKKPKLDQIELANKPITEVLRDMSDDNTSFSNPAVVNNQLYWLTFNRSFVLCPDGKMRRSFSTRYGRKLVTDNDILYFKVTPAEISRRFVFTEETTQSTFSILWHRLYAQCNFINEEQAKLLAAYVMYQYIYPHVDHIVHLQIIVASQRQRDYLFYVLKLFMPNSSSFKAKGTAAICSLYNGKSVGAMLSPFIIMDNFDTSDFDRGITLLIDKRMCPAPRPFVYKNFKSPNKVFKTKLYNWSISYTPALELELPMKSLYADVLTPLWAVLRSTSNGLKDLKLVRYIIARSRSFLRNNTIKDLPFAGYYDEELDELKKSEVEIEKLSQIRPPGRPPLDPDVPPASAQLHS